MATGHFPTDVRNRAKFPLPALPVSIFLKSLAITRRSEKMGKDTQVAVEKVKLSFAGNVIACTENLMEA